MKFDDILVNIGQFGLYQKRLYLLLCLPAISAGCYMMMLVFVMHAPDHRYNINRHACMGSQVIGDFRYQNIRHACKG